jgi:type II secretory pathway component PulJ
MTNLFDEAAENPLATVIVIVMLALLVYMAIKALPKILKNQRMLADHVASSNELTRMTHAVIENNSRVIENNTKTMELTQQSQKHLCEKVDLLTDRVDDYGQCTQSVLNKQTEIAALLRK